jgi:hypothetical protein
LFVAAFEELLFLSLSLSIVSTEWNYLSLQRVTDGEVAVLEYLNLGDLCLGFFEYAQKVAIYD